MMTDNAWAGLTEAQRKLLRRLINREQYPEFEIISRDGIHDSTVKALQSRGLIEDSYVLRLTPAGRAVYEASQAIDTPATEDADALTSAQARIAALESVLRKIADGAPTEKPIEDSDYLWDDLKEGREMSIASAHYVYGNDLGRWKAAEIARAALRAADALGEGR